METTPGIKSLSRLRQLRKALSPMVSEYVAAAGCVGNTFSAPSSAKMRSNATQSLKALLPMLVGFPLITTSFTLLKSANAQFPIAEILFSIIILSTLALCPYHGGLPFAVLL
jgi:hypothetical protein